MIDVDRDFAEEALRKWCIEEATDYFKSMSVSYDEVFSLAQRIYDWVVVAKA